MQIFLLYLKQINYFGVAFGDKPISDLIDLAFKEQKYLVFYEEHIKNDPLLVKYFGLVKVCTSRGWTLNFSTHVGLTLAGIAHYFSIIDAKVPVIATPRAFQSLVDKAIINVPIIAVVEAGVFSKDRDRHRGLHVFTILYEKKLYGHVLYIYDSLANKYDDFDSYFKQSYQVYFPDKARQLDSETTCHAYAIRDALLLREKLKSRCVYLAEDIITPVSLFFGLYEAKPKLTLSEAFIFDANAYKKQLFKEIFKFNNREYLDYESGAALGSDTL